MRWGLILAVPAAISIPLLGHKIGLELGEALLDSVRLLAGSFALPLFLCLAMGLEREPSERKCVLQSEGGLDWKHVLAFEITDHPTLPGVRCISIHHKSAPRETRDYFRSGQIDEAELCSFIETRIAEQRATRLMRRVRRKL